MEHNHHHKACNASAPNPKQNPNNPHTPNPHFSFSMEALAPCLADLKRQLELHQAMH